MDDIWYLLSMQVLWWLRQKTSAMTMIYDSHGLDWYKMKVIFTSGDRGGMSGYSCASIYNLTVEKRDMLIKNEWIQGSYSQVKNSVLLK